jgi:large subunit ribosomal protein L29
MTRVKDLRELNDQELRDRAAELQQALFKFRFQKVLGQLETPMQIRAARRDYARILTVLRERELELSREKSA